MAALRASALPCGALVHLRLAQVAPRHDARRGVALSATALFVIATVT